MNQRLIKQDVVKIIVEKLKGTKIHVDKGRQTVRKEQNKSYFG